MCVLYQKNTVLKEICYMTENILLAGVCVCVRACVCVFGCPAVILDLQNLKENSFYIDLLLLFHSDLPKVCEIDSKTSLIRQWATERSDLVPPPGNYG